MTGCLVKNCNGKATCICIDCYEGFCDEHIEHKHYTNNEEV